jgi:hypothetical protein
MMIYHVIGAKVIEHEILRICITYQYKNEYYNLISIGD